MFVTHVSHRSGGDHTGGVSHVSQHSLNQTSTPSGFHHASGENRLTSRDGKVILAPSDPYDQAHMSKALVEPVIDV
ncbi:unnamed protein product [Microthlaspi erraticum]|uniref:Uncharacterized protein n=1 Tax=Microthlaspi erraticum TaxID=1685480 RepID=A0A6D2KGJ9_9BRAS|nr:unnamed protein product [Microthlaspi erraticum]CAA7052250.1 unnamed protein product [Microthlaspi erraticum]